MHLSAGILGGGGGRGKYAATYAGMALDLLTLFDNFNPGIGGGGGGNWIAFALT